MHWVFHSSLPVKNKTLSSPGEQCLEVTVRKAISWLAFGLAAKNIGAASRITLDQVEREGVCYGKGGKARKEVEGGLFMGNRNLGIPGPVLGYL